MNDLRHEKQKTGQIEIKRAMATNCILPYNIAISINKVFKKLHHSVLILINEVHVNMYLIILTFCQFDVLERGIEKMG